MESEVSKGQHIWDDTIFSNNFPPHTWSLDPVIHNFVFKEVSKCKVQGILHPYILEKGPLFPLPLKNEALWSDTPSKTLDTNHSFKGLSSFIGSRCWLSNRGNWPILPFRLKTNPFIFKLSESFRSNHLSNKSALKCSIFVAANLKIYL